MSILSVSGNLRSMARLAKICLLAVALTLTAGTISRVSAASLVMFESTACVWCEAWHEEIGVIYDKTAEAQILPLRRVDVDDDEVPADLSHIEGIIYTPTFVVLDDGKEIGRILGYPGEDFFWQLLGEIIKKMENKRAGKL